MPGHMTKDKRKTLLLPVTESRGITIEQKQDEDKILELMAYRKRKAEKKEPYKYKTCGSYFENQQRIQMHH